MVSFLEEESSKNENSHTNWAVILFSQIGPAMGIPLLNVGFILNHNYGSTNATAIIFFGNLVLVVLGLIFGGIGFRQRQPTALSSNNYLSLKGAKAFSFILTSTALIWFGIQVNFLINLLDLFFSHYKFLCYLIFFFILSITVFAFSIKGWKVLIFMGLLNIIIFIGMMGLTFTIPSDSSSYINQNILENQFGGISFVISACIVGVIDLPSYTRFAKKEKDFFINVTVLYGILISLVELSGVYISHVFQTIEVKNFLIKLLNTYPISGPIVLFVFFITSSISAICASIYMSVSNLSPLLSNAPYWKRIILISLLGCIISTIPYFSEYRNIVLLTGMAIASIGGVFITSFFLFIWQSDNTYSADVFYIELVSIIVGFTFGASHLMYSDFMFTENMVLNSFLLSSITYFFLKTSKYLLKI